MRAATDERKREIWAIASSALRAEIRRVVKESYFNQAKRNLAGVTSETRPQVSQVDAFGLMDESDET